MVSHVDANGYLHNVQPGGNHPEAPDINPDHLTSKFGVGAFLLAGSEMYEYVSGGVADVNEGKTKPAGFALAQNYPNPFNPSTTIEYNLVNAGPVKLVVYDLLGREIATIINEVQNAGTHSVTFDASRLVSSVYFYKLEAGDFVSLKKMILIK